MVFSGKYSKMLELVFLSDNSHSMYPLLPVPLLCGDKEGEEGWLVQNYMFQNSVPNNALAIKIH